MDSKDTRKALEALEILSAQCGVHRIRSKNKAVIKAYIHFASKELGIKCSTKNLGTRFLDKE